MAEAWLEERFAAPCAPPEKRPAGPDVFNSVALPVKATMLDGRWEQASAATDEIADGQWAAFAGRATAAQGLVRLQMVNNWVNRRIAYVDDGRDDHWASLAETIARRRGDCEDFAIAKMQLLRRAGLQADALYLVIVTDTSRNADHAVLAVREDGEFLILDNRTDRILRSADIRDYRPIFSFASHFAWTHGYRSTQARPAARGAASAYRPAMPSSGR